MNDEANRAGLRRGPIRLAAIAALVWTAAATADHSTLAPVPEPLPAPGFELRDLDGRAHRLSEYREKVLIVNFWATWCPPCREEMPSLQRARERLRRDGVEVLAINVGEDEDTIFAFTAGYPMDFPLLLDEDGAVIDRWPVRGLPTTFVVDRRGRLAYRAIGAREWDDPGIVSVLRTLATERSR